MHTKRLKMRRAMALAFQGLAESMGSKVYHGDCEGKQESSGHGQSRASPTQACGRRKESLMNSGSRVLACL